MAFLNIWLDELSYTDFPSELFKAGQRLGNRPYASEIEEMLDTHGSIRASAVFCVGDQPTVCFINANSLGEAGEARVEQIRQRIWNQNLASIVIVLDESSLVAYSVSDREADPDRLSIEKIERHGQWSAYEIQSGFIKDRLSDWFSPEERVDQRLLSNLRAVVKRLEKDGLNNNQAESLMAQVIFICYLEQRSIVGDKYRQAHNLKSLEEYVVNKDGIGVDALLRQLGFDFNGDFLTSQDGGAPAWSALPRQSFKPIQSFLEAVDIETGQGSFWRYDFSHIPVELISGIYETLLKDRQGKLGAYYTPRHLANLVTEQAFEGVSDPSSCTVYDGACGSGILLTTAFRKILRNSEVYQGHRLRLSDRIKLMQKTIFGNDVDETACWITAFSLYLSLLEGLDPADIPLLQSDRKLKLPRLIGKGLNIQKGDERGDFFANENPFRGKRKFDVFLCNPPWRESDDEETPTWEAWCVEQKPPYPIGRRQIAAGFAYAAVNSVKAGGVITLILPLNLVIGATQQSCAFRQRWLEDVVIERIINFADVRRLLFAAAKHPCAVVRARTRARGESIISLGNESVEYWAPKTDVSLALGRLAVHADDQKLLSARDIYTKPYHLIINYWGQHRDAEFIGRLLEYGTVKEAMDANDFPLKSGKGFHAPNQSNKDRSLGVLSDLAFLDADRLPTDHPVIAEDSQLERVRDRFHVVASPGGAKGKLYHGPRVIFTDGLSDNYSIRAIYTAIPFAFTSSIGVIGGGAGDADLIKFLTAYLRSPLASYLMMMTGYSVIGERPRIAVSDIEAFPFCLPEDHPKRELATRIIKRVGRHFDRLAQVPEFMRPDTAHRHEARINRLVYRYFGLTKNEQALVNEVYIYVAASIQPADYKGINTPLLRKPSAKEITSYTSALSSELSIWRGRDGGKGALSIIAHVDGKDGFFGAVCITGRAKGEDSTSISRSESEFSSLIKDIQKSLTRSRNAPRRTDLFTIPNLMVIAGDSFYFIKPMRRRFWLTRNALADADHIVKTIHAAAWRKSYQ